VSPNYELTGENKDILTSVKGDLLHIKAEFEIVTGVSFGLNINGYKITYDMNHNSLNDVFLSPEENKIYLEILIDRNSIEIFANHGRLYLVDIHNSVDSPKQLELYSRGKTLLKNIEIYELKSIWEQ